VVCLCCLDAIYGSQCFAKREDCSATCFFFIDVDARSIFFRGLFFVDTLLVLKYYIHTDGAHIFYGGYFFHNDNGNAVLGPRKQEEKQ
jgi:hypothetical protein